MKLPMKIVLGLIAVLVCIAITQIDFTTQENEALEGEQKESIIKAASHTNKSATFVMAAKTAGLADMLSSEGPFTVFASTDSAFSQLPEGAFADMMDSANLEQLKKIVSYHIIQSKVYSSELEDGQKLQTLEGSELTITRNDDQILVNGAKVVRTDIESSNGVIHLVDQVMKPVDEKAKSITELKNSNQ